MNDRNNKFPNLAPGVNLRFLVSEPRYMPTTWRSVPELPLIRESIFKVSKLDDEFRDSQIAHAIYQIEINNNKI